MKSIYQISTFAEWVFNKCKGPRLTTSDIDFDIFKERIKTFGKTDHAEIERIMSSIENHIIGAPREYIVDFVDDDKSVFEASNLKIRGQAMRGRPDLVLRHRTKDYLIIVERKTTRQRRPINLEETARGNWLNIQAQLWCYSHLDRWRDAAGVTLVGEIWVHHERLLTRAIDPLVWFKTDPRHQDDCRALFRRYRDSLDCIEG
jgi:hypothetical protein